MGVYHELYIMGNGSLPVESCIYMGWVHGVGFVSVSMDQGGMRRWFCER